jgi:hypothetical protein
MGAGRRLRVSSPTAPPPRLPVQSGAHERAEAPHALALVADLPQRRQTFLALKPCGHTYDAIADELGVSWRTVDRQLVRARRALHDREGTEGVVGASLLRARRQGSQHLRAHGPPAQAISLNADCVSPCRLRVPASKPEARRSPEG